MNDLFETLAQITKPVEPKWYCEHCEIEFKQSELDIKEDVFCPRCLRHEYHEMGDDCRCESMGRYKYLACPDCECFLAHL